MLFDATQKSCSVVFLSLALSTHKLMTSHGSFGDSYHSTFACLHHMESDDSTDKIIVQFIHTVLFSHIFHVSKSL